MRELLKKIDEENEQENAQYGENDLEEYQKHEAITSDEIKEVAETLKKKLKQMVKELESDIIPRKEKYKNTIRLSMGAVVFQRQTKMQHLCE